MNQPETQVELQGAAIPAGAAKRHGKRLAKIWMAAYACLIVAYVAHGLTGAEFMRLDALTEGRRLWRELYVELNGKPLEIDAGEAVSPATLRGLQSGATLAGGFTREGDAWRRAEKGPAAPSLFIALYKTDAFHGLPWRSILGLFNFAGLALLLYTLLGDPLPAFLRACSNAVRERLAAARAAQIEAAALQGRERELMAQLEAESVQAMEQAARDAGAEREYLVEAAKCEAEKMTVAMRRHLEADEKAAAAQLRAAVVRRVLEQARVRFAAGMEGEAQDRMIRAFVRQLEGMDRHD
ncbi:MAG: hypothetical protein A2498_09905 [Lentisphaerae bacterium RIFOXYC12_FULL_60_16]|nr:MAG: hypothetical protein A2498_09905 [Lentisphaerae bacterium RIFOXYC12_FULL_60_16]